MVIKIKCEVMTVWDFDHCIECKRFKLQRGKGLKNWGCKLNKETPEERRGFSKVWAMFYLQYRGFDVTIPEVAIIPVSKRKKKGQ